MYFLWYFQEHNQTSENIFRNFFWNATKHMKIFSFLKNSISGKYLFSGNAFTRTKRSPSHHPLLFTHKVPLSLSLSLYLCLSLPPKLWSGKWEEVWGFVQRRVGLQRKTWGCIGNEFMRGSAIWGGGRKRGGTFLSFLLLFVFCFLG